MKQFRQFAALNLSNEVKKQTNNLDILPKIYQFSTNKKSYTVIKRQKKLIIKKKSSEQVVGRNSEVSSKNNHDFVNKKKTEKEMKNTNELSNNSLSQMAEDELDESGTLYCLGDIVHNAMEVERLAKKGLKIIQNEDLKS